MSIISRLRQATSTLLGKQERLTGHNLMEWFRFAGQPHHFKPEQSLDFYGENPYFKAGLDVICFEVSRTPFFLEERSGDEWTKVQKHQALESLKTPVPGATGKSHITQRQLFYLLAQHQLLNGEAFWLL